MESEALFYEFQQRRELIHRLRDEPGLCKGRDDDQRNPRTEAKVIGGWRRHMIIEAAEIIPSEEDRGRNPIGAPHHRVELPDGPVLTHAGALRWVLAHPATNDDPADRRQAAAHRVRDEARWRNNIFGPQGAQADVADRIERRPDVPALARIRSVVSPGDARFLKAVRQR